jgi:hypothetical protein
MTERDADRLEGIWPGEDDPSMNASLRRQWRFSAR